MTATIDRLSRVRRMATSKAALLGLILIALYGLAGFLLAPWLVRQQFPAYVDKQFGATGTVQSVRVNPFLLKLEAEGLAIAEKNGAPVLRVGRVLIDFEASSVLRRAWTFREIRIDRPVLHAELDARDNLNLARLLEHAGKAGAPRGPAPSQPPRLLVQHLAVTGGLLEFTDRTLQPAATAQFRAVDVDMHDVATLPDRTGDHTISARLPSGGALQWRGQFRLSPVDLSGAIELTDGRLATLWRFEQDHLAIAEPAGAFDLNLRYRVRYGNGKIDVQAEDVALRLRDVLIARARGGEPLAKLASIEVEGGTFDMQQRSVAFKSLRVADGVVNVAIDADGKPDWAALWRDTGATTAVSPDPKTPGAAPWRVTLPSVSVSGVALGLRDDGRVRPLDTTVGTIDASFGVAASTGAAPQVSIDGATIRLSRVSVRARSGKEPLLEAASMDLVDGGFDMLKKSVRARAVTISGGRTRVERDAGGRLNLDGAFDPKRRQDYRQSGYVTVIDRFELSDHAIVFSDLTYEPALNVELERVRAVASPMTLPAAKGIPVEFALTIRSGGSLKANGVLDPARPAADFRFAATDVALAPLDAVLRRYATLTVASGKGGIDGRISWNARSAPGALRYAGSARITDLELKRESVDERLFSWKQLDAADIAFDSAANQLNVRQIGIVQPYAKLVINKDKSTNLSGLARTRDKPGAQEGAPMAVRIDRVSVERGGMDFSDLSLVLPFETRISALGGAVTGLSSDAASRASLKFEGQIEDYGLARAEGTVQPFAPRALTDIAVTFRNIAMTPLTPYSATFAGRRIASGRLSLDLQYRLANGKLAGENRMLLEKFTLGERVESPSALSLPLDLAIALLTDSSGRIDLSVPVSGDVDHPEFSYGHLVWQAIRTVIGRIVSAPFRALGALFGGNTETLGDIVFDPGSARILPTEQEKLARVAIGMQNRPQLRLVVEGRHDREHDPRALRTLAVRADLAAREGMRLAPGEDPGPAAFHSAKTQRALETLLTERAGGDAVAQFAADFRRRSGRDASRVNIVLAVMDRGAGDRELYEALFQHLVALRELAPTALAELSKARTEAIAGALTVRLKFEPSRLAVRPPAPADDATARGVASKLSFEPMR